MDWSSVFDEAYPAAGASDTDIERFVREIGQPMSAAEIKANNRSQSNPYPSGYSLHSTWRPIDAATWIIPDRPLPATYLSFLKWTNGGEFRTGNRWFQFFPTRGSGNGVRDMLLAYQFPEYMPGALPIALNGAGTFYVLDWRQGAVQGEYPIVCAHSGYLSWARDAWCLVAESFEAACRGGIDVDELRG